MWISAVLNQLIKKYSDLCGLYLANVHCYQCLLAGFCATYFKFNMIKYVVNILFVFDTLNFYSILITQNI